MRCYSSCWEQRRYTWNRQNRLRRNGMTAGVPAATIRQAQSGRLSLVTTIYVTAQAMVARQAAIRCLVLCALAAKTRGRSSGCACARAPFSTPRHSHNERHEHGLYAVGAREAAHDPYAGMASVELALNLADGRHTLAQPLHFWRRRHPLGVGRDICGRQQDLAQRQAQEPAVPQFFWQVRAQDH